MNTVKVFENRKVRSVWKEEDLETELIGAGSQRNHPENQ